MAETMRAVVFKKPKVVELEERPRPNIQEPTDAICKVDLTALCGSELHVFRGHQPSPTGFIMGHEFTGTVEEVGTKVTGFKKGDQIVSPFTLSCGECFFCQNAYSSRCALGALYGTGPLDGAQSQYVRVPLAQTTLFPAPPPSQIPPPLLVLMADIFPTGYFGARNAFKEFTAQQAREATCVLVGCGPVGLCALVNMLDYQPKRVFAVDSVPSRLEMARSLGAEPIDFTGPGGVEGAVQKVKSASEGRGADVVVEVVGLSPALRMAFDMLRNWGVISSLGVHNDNIPWTAKEAYGKNLRIQQGRCPVRSIFPEALEKLKEKHHMLGFMAEKVMPLTQAVEGYELFDSMKVQKVVFEAQE